MKVPSTEFFGTVRQKKFRRKPLIPTPPPLIHKLFGYRKFSETKHRRVPLPKVLVLWDKKIRRRTFDNPLLSINFFATRNFLKHRPEGSLYRVFRHCETKNIRRKPLIPTPPPPLSINFLATENFLKHSIEGFLFEKFRYCGTKKFRRKLLITPLLSINFFATRNFLKHSTEGFLFEKFRHC